MSDALVIEAVRKVVIVDCTVEEAFRVFTADARSWWPVATHSIHGEEVRQIVVEGHEGGEVYEVAASGAPAHWATVISWEPPNRVVLSWNVLQRDAVGTEVEITFAPEGNRTRVDLEHRGWETIGEDAEVRRANYDTGWDNVLGRYEARLS